MKADDLLTAAEDDRHDRAETVRGLALKLHDVCASMTQEQTDTTIFAGDVVEALLRVAAATMVAFNPDLNDDLFPRWSGIFQKQYITYTDHARSKRGRFPQKGGTYGSH